MSAKATKNRPNKQGPAKLIFVKPARMDLHTQDPDDMSDTELALWLINNQLNNICYMGEYLGVDVTDPDAESKLNFLDERCDKDIAAMHLIHAWREMMSLDGKLETSDESLRQMLTICNDAIAYAAPLLILDNGDGSRSEVERLTYERTASKLALVRHSRDPRRKEKEFVFECWVEWQKDRSRYSGKAAFASDMLNTKRDWVSHLKSVRVIEDWCREWEAKAKK